MKLYKEVTRDECKWNLKGRNILINLCKKESDGDSWPRLPESKAKNNHIDTDWSRY